jgi:DNA topoisomerase-1
MGKSSRRTSRRRGVGPFTAPEDAAKAADLRHVSDDRPGITRKRSGRGFSYADPDGTAIRDRATLARIRALAIPPAWTDVWICPMPHGHIQATGRDARHRKQYRYHPRWQQVRDATKYGRMVEFGTALPKIRARLQTDLGLSGIPKDKVLATIVRLLETTFIRVGNEEYARTNRSFGLTTLQDRHVEIEGSQIQFRFRGKSGKLHAVKLTDRRLARAVQRIRELPGQDVFQFLDEAGEPQSIDSADVNEYLRTISGQEFTAKDFRTWAGTLLAALELEPSRCFDDDVSPKSAEVAAIASVAAQLGNTPAVCRKGYIHPAILEAYQDRAAFDAWLEECASDECPEGLMPQEAALLRFLKSRELLTSKK